MSVESNNKDYSVVLVHQDLTGEVTSGVLVGTKVPNLGHAFPGIKPANQLIIANDLLNKIIKGDNN